MKILQVGVEKSGNYWLYNIISQILSHSGINVKSYIKQTAAYDRFKGQKLSYKDQAGIDTVEVRRNKLHAIITSIYEEEITNVEEYTEKVSHVWTHSTCTDSIQELMKSMDKTICIVRDPRDILISKSKFAFTDYSLKYRNSSPGKSPEDFINKRLVPSSLRWNLHVMSFLKSSLKYPIHFVHYENLLSNFSIELDKMLYFLGIELTEDQRSDIEEKVNFLYLQKKDPKHVRKGKSMQWLDSLTQRQNKKVLDISEPLLKFFNYPLRPEEDISFNIGGQKSIDPKVLSNLEHQLKSNLFVKIKWAFSLLKDNRSMGNILRKGFQFILNKY